MENDSAAKVKLTILGPTGNMGAVISCLLINKKACEYQNPDRLLQGIYQPDLISQNPLSHQINDNEELLLTLCFRRGSDSYTRVLENGLTLFVSEVKQIHVAPADFDSLGIKLKEDLSDIDDDSQHFILCAINHPNFNSSLTDALNEKILPDECGYIVPLHNGIQFWWEDINSVDPRGQYRQRIGRENMIGAVSYIAANHVENRRTVVKLTKPLEKAYLEIGIPGLTNDGSIPAYQKRALARLSSHLQSSQIEARFENIYTAVLRKMQVNYPVNTLSALTGMNIRELYSSDEHRLLILIMGQEIAELGRYAGLSTEHFLSVNEMKQELFLVGDHYPSMCVQFQDGQRIEYAPLVRGPLELLENSANKSVNPFVRNQFPVMSTMNAIIKDLNSEIHDGRRDFVNIRNKLKPQLQQLITFTQRINVPINNDKKPLPDIKMLHEENIALRDEVSQLKTRVEQLAALLENKISPAKSEAQTSEWVAAPPKSRSFT